MSDCKHEPIEIEYPMRGPKGERYMQALFFSELQPSVRPTAGWRPAVPDRTPPPIQYALMGCRHCKAPFIDAVPPMRVVDTNTDPFRSEGG